MTRPPDSLRLHKGGEIVINASSNFDGAFHPRNCHCACRNGRMRKPSVMNQELYDAHLNVVFKIQERKKESDKKYFKDQ